MTDTYTHHFWTPLRVYSTYRIVLAVALLVVLYLVPSSLVHERGQYDSFLICAVLYLVLTLFSAVLMNPLRRWWPEWASLLPIFSDIIMLTLMIHFGGGIQSNLSVVLMVTVAAASILLPGRGGLLVAALASLAVMFEQFWFSIQVDQANPWKLTESGLLGFAFFITAVIIHLISRRLAESEALAQSQRKAILRLEELNRHIVQRMRTGILVFDHELRIVMANKAATSLMTSGNGTLENSLLPPVLTDVLRQWQFNPSQPRPSVQLRPGGATVLVRFARLDHDDHSLTLAFLEDQRQLAQEAQQLKLASLGRLSATIAHEIRNPLSAISHATGLLAEDISDPASQRLLNIVSGNIQRMNRIIEDVLSLSRRQASAAERITLDEFLARVRQHWLAQGLAESQIRIDATPGTVVRFDPGQLEQILQNLVSNAFHHGGSDVTVTLEAGPGTESGLPWLAVSDNGSGIQPESRQHLFEPFFTTSRQGTGLGLYVSRELCEANQAQLELAETATGTRFVITFAHPDRVFQ